MNPPLANLYNPGDEDMIPATNQAMSSHEKAQKAVANVRRVIDVISIRSVDGIYWQTAHMGDGAYLQATTEHGGGGRKWYVSSYAGDNEIAQTMLMAAIAYVEHEIRESFRYQGVAVFAPHYDLDELAKIAHKQVHRSAGQ